MRPKLVEIGHGYFGWNDDDGLDEWYDGYKNSKAQKSEIKGELIMIALHPSR